MNSINHFTVKKSSGEKITMMTCYDAAFSSILAETEVDALLVGDSLAMVIHGQDSTLGASVEMMSLHTAAVRRGAPEAFIVTDIPFPEHRYGPTRALETAAAIMKAGANAVKIEGADGHLDTLRFLIQSGIPVMGHLGLTPQSVHQLGGYKLQARSQDEADDLLRHALLLEEAGCFALVLECVPAALGKQVSEALTIPVIGIGAGPDTDGQVLVLHDALGLGGEKMPRFVRPFLNGRELVKNSINAYSQAVSESHFPSAEESYR